MKKFLIVSLFAMCCMETSLHAQKKDLNNYKYVIVPLKYDFLSEKDQYKLNSLTEFLFEKYGFTAILEGEEFPADLVSNPCSALNADVLSDSGMFSFLSKVKIVLKTCNQQVIFESKEGKSKLKSHEFGYQQALRDAFSSVEALNYSYSPPIKTEEMPSEKTSEKPMADKKAKKPATDLVLTKDGKNFFLEKRENGFLLKAESSEKTVAQLNQTSRGDYIYRSETVNGNAYFDEKGNLTVEYFDVNEGKMKVFEFKIQGSKF